MNRDDGFAGVSRRRLTARLCGAFVFLVSLSAGLSTHAASASVRTEFVGAILRAEAQVVDLTAESDLLRSKDFLMIYGNPASFYRDAIAFISDPHRTKQQATIAILSMQRLPFGRYLDFCEEAFALRREGTVSEDIFEKACFPGYDWNAAIQENYSSARVRALLSQIRSSGLLHAKSGDGDSVEYIDSILSGEADRYVKELRASGQIP